MDEEQEKKEVIFLDKNGSTQRASDLEEWLREAFFRGNHDDITKIMAFLPKDKQEHYRAFLIQLIRERKIEGGV